MSIKKAFSPPFPHRFREKGALAGKPKQINKQAGQNGMADNGQQ